MTDCAALTVTVQVPVPLHAPDHPVKALPTAAVADSTTEVPDRNDDVHVAPQLMPAGLDVTVPEPLPLFDTVSVYGTCWNVAVTVRAAVIETRHVDAVPEHEPDHPVNLLPLVGDATNVTDVPDGSGVEHDAEQFKAGEPEVTCPFPPPAVLTVSA